MLQFMIMIGFSVILVAYGLIALFKKDWIWKVREFSARLEGKGQSKRDAGSNLDTMGNIMGVFALVLGILGIIMNVAIFVVL